MISTVNGLLNLLYNKPFKPQAFKIATLYQHGNCWITILKETTKTHLIFRLCLSLGTMDQVCLLGVQTRLNTHCHNAATTPYPVRLLAHYYVCGVRLNPFSW